MKRFKQRDFSSGGLIKKGFIQGLSNPVGLASLGVSATALATTRSNYKMQKARIKQADTQHEEIKKQNERLIRALSGVENGLNKLPQQQQQPQVKKTFGRPKKDNAWLRIGGRKIFSEKQKSYGDITEGFARGGFLGAGLTTSLILPLTKAGITGTSKAKAATVLVGAALGALAGTIWGITKTVNTRISQSETGHELIKKVVKNFKRAGYKRDKDWTMDAKAAGLMKTKVCIVVSRRADELGVLINMVNDERLKQVSEDIIKNLPVQKQKTEKVSDKFNDLQITSFPDSSDPVFVFSVAERFIKRGFPVYIMEVG